MRFQVLRVSALFYVTLFFIYSFFSLISAFYSSIVKSVQQLENSQRRFEATNARIAQQMRQQRENMGKTSGVQSPESVKPPKKESEALEEEVQFFEKRLNFLKESRKNEKLYWSTIQRHESGMIFL
jgi:hypothetical protein